MLSFQILAPHPSNDQRVGDRDCDSERETERERQRERQRERVGISMMVVFDSIFNFLNLIDQIVFSTGMIDRIIVTYTVTLLYSIWDLDAFCCRRGRGDVFCFLHHTFFFSFFSGPYVRAVQSTYYIRALYTHAVPYDHTSHVHCVRSNPFP